MPRLSDQQAAVKAKGLARLVKWWRDIERYGPGFDATDREEIEAALDRGFASPGEARQAFAEAVAARSLDRDTAIRLCHAQRIGGIRA